MEDLQGVRGVSDIEGIYEGGVRVTNKGSIKRIGSFIARRKAFFAIIIITIFAGYGVYSKYFNAIDAADMAQKELFFAVAAVGELMILPEGDEPVLATVTDAEALIAQQAFFTGAIDGDQLLLFPKNMKAVIYSPSRNKIINAGPIEQQAQNQETSAAADINQETQAQNSSVPLTIAFYNGTEIVNFANETELKLKSIFSGFKTVAKTNAENKDYKETIVIDVTGGTKSAEVQSIALALGATVGGLPSGEAKPDADILIIAGRQ